MKPTEDRRLARVAKICLTLPEAVRQDMDRHSAFTVRKRTFAYFLNDHHGDGIVGINCRVLSGDNTKLAAEHPDRFYMPAYLGSKGWVGLRLDREPTDWDEVTELLRGSYWLVAPKRLAEFVTREAEAAQPSR